MDKLLTVKIATDTAWNESAERLPTEELQAHVATALYLFHEQFPNIEVVLQEQKLAWESPELPFFGDFPNNQVQELLGKDSPQDIIKGLWAAAETLNLRASMLLREEEITGHLTHRYSAPQRKRVYLRGLLGRFLTIADGTEFIERVRRDLEQQFPCASTEFVFGFTGRCITTTRIYENYGKSMLGAQHLVCRIPLAEVAENFWKVILHEFGHLLQAEHEMKTASIMHFSFGNAEATFDSKNKERIQRYVETLKRSPTS